MTQRIGHHSEWQELREGETFDFKADKPRTIRVDTNAPQEVALYVFYESHPEEARFLALTAGLDTIIFDTDEPCKLAVEGTMVLIRTADGTATHVTHADDRVFARIHEKRARNYEMELIERMMHANAERRIGAMVAEAERRINEREAQDNARRASADAAAAAQVNSAAASAAPAATTPEPQAGGVQPAGAPNQALAPGGGEPASRV